MDLPEEMDAAKEPVGRCMRFYRFSVIIERDRDGYFAFCPELQGCYTQGDTYEEALENIRDAIRLHVEDRLAAGEEIPQSEYVSMTSLEVAV
jgi:predicted RNase H-like HicB family nuclease